MEAWEAEQGDKADSESMGDTDDMSASDSPDGTSDTELETVRPCMAWLSRTEVDLGGPGLDAIAYGQSRLLTDCTEGARVVRVDWGSGGSGPFRLGLSESIGGDGPLMELAGDPDMRESGHGGEQPPPLAMPGVPLVIPLAVVTDGNPTPRLVDATLTLILVLGDGRGTRLEMTLTSVLGIPSPPGCLAVVSPGGATDDESGLPFIDFGQVAVGAVHEARIVLRACGTDPVDITGIDVAPEPAPRCPPPLVDGFTPAWPAANCGLALRPAWPWTPLQVSPGIDLAFLVRLVAPAPGEVALDLVLSGRFQARNPHRLHPNDAARVRVRARAVEPRLAVYPRPVVFAPTPVGCMAPSESVRVYNAGLTGITVEVPELFDGPSPVVTSGDTDTGADDENDSSPGGESGVRFTFAESPPSAPRFLPPGDGFFLRLSALATRPGDHTGTLRLPVRTGTGPASPVDTALVLHAPDRDEFHERFVQNDRPRVDVLWAIDCSGSMSEEQDLLAREFPRFAEAALRWDADWRVAIVSCDTEDGRQAGRFRGDPPVKDASALAEYVVPAFSRDARLGTACSATERCLQAVHLALAADPGRPLAERLRRPDATLGVFIISDEDDQSPWSPERYVDAWRAPSAEFPDGSEVRVYAVAGPEGGCQSRNGGATPGVRYERAVAASGGQFRSICESDFGAIHRGMGDHVFERRRRFRLVTLPDPTSLRVTVNGEPQRLDIDYTLESDASDHSPGDPNARVVVFSLAPPSRAVIDVEYRARCGP